MLSRINHIKPINSPLYVIAAVSNPVRYQSRYKLYWDFAKHISDAGGVLATMEMAFGDRQFEITDKGNPLHFQVRSFHELWHKENLINLAISRLPEDWEYVAWVDADIAFSRADWVQETLHQLQHHMFVQMFSHAIELGPKGEPIQNHTGFVYGYLKGVPLKREYLFLHPGYAWAARREALEHVGGLIDTAILGAADHHMATALVGQHEFSMHGNAPKAYRDPIVIWQNNAEQYIKRDIGFVPGTIIHHFHGKKADRKYVERWKIILDNNFDPALDLKKDPHGLWQLTDRNIKLREDIRKYFRARAEDSIDL